jgi:hypothetical protein
MFSGKSLGRHLEQVLSSAKFLRFYSSLSSEDPVLRPLHTPALLLEALKKEGLSPERQDEVLVALIRRYQASPNGNMNCLLLEVFRPALSQLFHSLRTKRPDGSDLWADLTWTLLNLLWEYPLDRLPRKVAANVQLGILKRMTREAIRDSRYVLFSGERNRPLADEFDFQSLLGDGIQHPNEIFAGRGEAYEPDEDDLARMETLLRLFLNEGVIDEASFYLLLATRVYRRSVQDYAQANALSYEAAKKRRKRAELDIRKAVLEKEQHGDVPLSDLKGFYGEGGAPHGGHDEETPE